MISNDLSDMKVAPALNTRIGNSSLGVTKAKSSVVHAKPGEAVNPTKDASEIEYIPMIERVQSNSDESGVNMLA